MANEVKTTCPYCGVGCGVIATTEKNGKVIVQGDPKHPSNFGRLCSKGAALADTIELNHRLLHPMSGSHQTSWDQAIENVASGFKRIIEHHGPDAVAFYVSGQLLTEDYYVANKLMKGFIGSANIDTNSRLCMSSSVAGHKRAFGSDTVPCSYEDLEQANLITLVGSNTAWCHPVLYQRIRDAKVRRPHMKVVVIDPRRTATCEIADIHLPLVPGSDIDIFLALLDYLDRHDALDREYIAQHTEGFEMALERARTHDDPIKETARKCGVSPVALEQFFRLFLEREKSVTVYSQGVNQWSFGTDKVNAIINCHLATGRIGKAGMGPFSFTGQPNAMGGREVGGLANQLAAHMDFEPQDIERVKRFWKAPNMAKQPGLNAVDMFDAMIEGRIKAVWIMATNPAVSMPDADRIKTALEQCEFVVMSDCVSNTDTAKYADVLLPATTWGEKNGTVTNSERRISRQRAFLDTPGEARDDWKIISDVARAMGYSEAFSYRRVEEILREHAALSGLDNHGTRDFDISAYAGVTSSQYEKLRPTLWPFTQADSGANVRLLSNGRFFTDSGKARFVAVTRGKPANSTQPKLPLILNTGRIRDQWHTMTRTGSAPRLNQHIHEPFVEINPDDAELFDIRNGTLANISTASHTITARAVVSTEQRPGSLFIPMHWSDATAQNSSVNKLVASNVDPISGQPEFKHSPVQITAYTPLWQGFILINKEIDIDYTGYCIKSRGNGFWRYEIAGEKEQVNWLELLKYPFSSNVELLEFSDIAQHRFRFAVIEDSRLLGCLYISRDRVLADHAWLGKLFCKKELSHHDRRSLLAGHPMNPADDCGKTICACFSVGNKTLLHEINHCGLDSIEAIGDKLKAGTSCGSCIPEIKGLLSDTHESY
ncbi:MAG: molybdopterin-dependent oxidoreductase [Candidatus Thiodiazotropha endolucinida]|uniref:Molybdopterin-dependent oxidoreductase n=1 Tax=Candidatus Thiodiazotropha taylori TaxID=2792791 RepID=A0A9E4NLF5_9GAMM|nr:molybdopterin-dependent oxidoreductase [Candidatus Thiodiazotropha taylori]MCW4237038.1 molybdopterin-dependent oxidoreductase [Candidatus Thiodiazotropha endolucinida]